MHKQPTSSNSSKRKMKNGIVHHSQGELEEEENRKRMRMTSTTSELNCRNINEREQKIEPYPNYPNYPNMNYTPMIDQNHYVSKNVNIQGGENIMNPNEYTNETYIDMYLNKVKEIYYFHVFYHYLKLGFPEKDAAVESKNYIFVTLSRYFSLVKTAILSSEDSIKQIKHCVSSNLSYYQQSTTLQEYLLQQQQQQQEKITSNPSGDFNNLPLYKPMDAVPGNMANLNIPLQDNSLPINLSAGSGPIIGGSMFPSEVGGSGFPTDRNNVQGMNEMDRYNNTNNNNNKTKLNEMKYVMEGMEEMPKFRNHTNNLPMGRKEGEELNNYIDLTNMGMNKRDVTTNSEEKKKISFSLKKANNKTVSVSNNNKGLSVEGAWRNQNMSSSYGNYFEMNNNSNNTINTTPLRGLKNIIENKETVKEVVSEVSDISEENSNDKNQNDTIVNGKINIMNKHDIGGGYMSNNKNMNHINNNNKNMNQGMCNTNNMDPMYNNKMHINNENYMNQMKQMQLGNNYNYGNFNINKTEMGNLYNNQFMNERVMQNSGSYGMFNSTHNMNSAGTSGVNASYSMNNSTISGMKNPYEDYYSSSGNPNSVLNEVEVQALNKNKNDMYAMKGTHRLKREQEFSKYPNSGSMMNEPAYKKQAREVGTNEMKDHFDEWMHESNESKEEGKAGRRDFYGEDSDYEEEEKDKYYNSKYKYRKEEEEEEESEENEDDVGYYRKNKIQAKSDKEWLSSETPKFMNSVVDKAKEQEHIKQYIEKLKEHFAEECRNLKFKNRLKKFIFLFFTNKNKKRTASIFHFEHIMPTKEDVIKCDLLFYIHAKRVKRKMGEEAKEGKDMIHNSSIKMKLNEEEIANRERRRARFFGDTTYQNIQPNFNPRKKEVFENAFYIDDGVTMDYNNCDNMSLDKIIDKFNCAECYRNTNFVGECRSIQKFFFRLTSLPEKKNVRSFAVLKCTYAYILYKYNNDRNYKYINEQFRSLRQDLNIQSVFHNDVINMYEANIRICIVNNDLFQFLQCINKLFELYQKLNIRKSKIEFLCYKLIYLTLQNMHQEFYREYLVLSDDEKKHPNIQLCHYLNECMKNKMYLIYVSLISDLNQEENHAYIYSRIYINNHILKYLPQLMKLKDNKELNIDMTLFTSFINNHKELTPNDYENDILYDYQNFNQRSEKLTMPYLSIYLIILFLPKYRLLALINICKTSLKVQISTVTHLLNFESEDLCLQFLEEVNAVINNKEIMSKASLGNLLKSPLLKNKYINHIR